MNLSEISGYLFHFFDAGYLLEKFFLINDKIILEVILHFSRLNLDNMIHSEKYSCTSNYFHDISLEGFLYYVLV